MKKKISNILLIVVLILVLSPFIIGLSFLIKISNEEGKKLEELDEKTFKMATIDNFLEKNNGFVSFIKFDNVEHLNCVYTDYDNYIYEVMVEAKYDEVRDYKLNNVFYRLCITYHDALYVNFYPDNNIFEVHYFMRNSYQSSSQNRYYSIDNDSSEKIDEYIENIIKTKTPSYYV